MIRESLARLYGAAISVEYYDAAEAEQLPDHAATLAALRAEQLPLPLVLVDHEVWFAGSIQPWQVVAAITSAWQRQQR